MATVVDLGKQVKAKYPGVYDDLSDEALGLKVKAKFPGSYDDFSDKTINVNGHARRRPQKPQDAKTEEPKGRGLPGLLPGAGGFVGGLLGKVGGPAGGIAGAGAGGALGEIIAQAIESPVPFGMGGAPNLGAIGGAAGEQAIYEAGGRLLGAGAKFGGKKLMQAAIKVTPEVAQTAIREGITATKGGLKKLTSRIIQTAKAEEQIVRAAAGQGQGWVDPGKLARQVFQDAAKHFQGAPTKQTAKLSELMEEFVRDNAQDISPVKMLKMRRYYDLASANLKQQKLKGSPEQVWNQLMSNAVRKQLQESIPSIVDPVAYAKITKRATTPAELQLVREGLAPLVKHRGFQEQLIARSVPAAVGTSVGALTPSDDIKERAAHAAVGGIVGSAFTTPQALSYLALLMRNPALTGAVAQAPRGIAELIRE